MYIKYVGKNVVLYLIFSSTETVKMIRGGTIWCSMLDGLRHSWFDLSGYQTDKVDN